MREKINKKKSLWKFPKAFFVIGYYRYTDYLFCSGCSCFGRFYFGCYFDSCSDCFVCFYLT
jgi:hypothetical protein